jgi:hypothetical protein
MNGSISMEAESAIRLGAIALIVILKNTNALVKPHKELKHFHGAESVILQVAVLLNVVMPNVVAAAKPLNEWKHFHGG